MRDRARTKWPARDLRRVGAWLARLGAALARIRNFAPRAGCLGVPLVVSLHSVVGMDFAASLMPGWQETIFPPYFVVGAMYSGFAMVVCLAALVRWGFRMQALITLAHFDVMAKIMLAAAIIMGLSYATEWFTAWYGGEHADRSLLAFEFTGAYAPMYWALLLCNVIIPQAFWFAPVRRSVVAVFVDRRRHQYRHVARTHPHHLEHAVARLPAEHVAAVPADDLGLDHHIAARSACSRSCFSSSCAWCRSVSMHEVRKLVDEEGS